MTLCAVVLCRSRSPWSPALWADDPVKYTYLQYEYECWMWYGISYLPEISYAWIYSCVTTSLLIELQCLELPNELQWSNCRNSLIVEMTYTVTELNRLGLQRSRERGTFAVAWACCPYSSDGSRAVQWLYWRIAAITVTLIRRHSTLTTEVNSECAVELVTKCYRGICKPDCVNLSQKQQRETQSWNLSSITMLA